MSYTCGFFDARERRRHFANHGPQLGIANETEYEQLADTFLGAPKAAEVIECTRSQGDVVRFDTTTEMFGVLDCKRMIRTFYKPVPCCTVPLPQKTVLRMSGRCHGKANNLLYFRAECERW